MTTYTRGHAAARLLALAVTALLLPGAIPGAAARGTGRLRGTVRAQTLEGRPGPPVPGARLRFTSAPSRSTVEVHAGPGGEYRVDLPEGVHALVVHAPGYSPWVRPAVGVRADGGSRTLNPSLWPTSHLRLLPSTGTFPRGEPPDDPSGAPRPARVRLLPGDLEVAVGSPLEVRVEALPGVRLHEVLLECEGCPLLGAGRARGRVVQRARCSRHPCAAGALLRFATPGSYVLVGRGRGTTDRHDHSLPYAVVRVTDAPRAPAEGRPTGWLGEP